MGEKTGTTGKDIIGWLVIAGFVVAYVFTRMVYRNETDNIINSSFNAYPILLPATCLLVFLIFTVDDFRKIKKEKKGLLKQLLSILGVLFFSALLIKGLTNAF